MVSKSTARVLILASLVLTTVAQLLFRYGMQSFGLHELVGQADTQALFAWLLSPGSLFVLAGIACYGASLICWVVAISQFELSVAYPLLSVTYIFVYAAAVYLPWFGEQASMVKLAGIILIMGGVALVARSHHGNSQ
jgi:undecaprenyl phosphate-alpha-L-ara4N flippase subunit ArnF